MTLHCDVLVVGAGPAGLSCARTLAAANADVLVVERKKVIGPKVCAGGITRDGLIRRVPASLIERSFCEQSVFSNHQHVVIREKDPVIATVNRTRLGQWMQEDAQHRGAKILTDTRVVRLEPGLATVQTGDGPSRQIRFDRLVGADGSSSLVRRWLNIPVQRLGIGINYQIPGNWETMEWHLNTRFFGYGYAWIFPHAETLSVGAYMPRGNMPPALFHKRLHQWAQEKGIILEQERGRADLINYDFKGYQFGRTWLLGDAAGLASGLTGEGIYPAIVSGESIAAKIIDPAARTDSLAAMIRKQRLHQFVIDLSAKNNMVCSGLMEMLIFMLRFKIINFHVLEMAD